MEKTLTFFDTSLRDGAQTMGVDFSIADKQVIATALDEFGIDYVEGGWPGANPSDDQFFANPPIFQNAKLVAFGMTRRADTSAGNDPSLAMLVQSSATALCLVGKAWDFHVLNALQISLEDNLQMIADSIAHGKKHKEAVFYDAEHFFDGYKDNPDYAMQCLEAAEGAGVDTLVLCDTNGGTLPHEIYKIVRIVKQKFTQCQIGIHSHNDTGNASANSVAAVMAGARHIQGTLNGIGERCGNADLVNLIPTLLLKLDFQAKKIDKHKLTGLVKLSRLLDDRLNWAPNASAPYVGMRAFAHKGGLHVSAMVKHSRTYEHILPEIVGNERRVIISNQAGRANFIERLAKYDVAFDKLEKYLGQKIMDTLKNHEANGYSYDGAEASFVLLVFRILGKLPEYYQISRFRVIDETRFNRSNEKITESEATVNVKVEGREETMTVARGKGPVNALDKAMRIAILEYYPELATMQLVDYKVRIIPPSHKTIGTDAVTRVTIESKNADDHHWVTIGVSDNIIDASMQALDEAYRYNLRFLHNHN